MSIDSIFTYETASARRHPFWELDVGNWGNMGATADATSILIPNSNIPAGAHYIGLSPSSTVDQAHFELLLPGEPAATSSPSFKGFDVSVHSPIYKAFGAVTVQAAITSLYGDTYRRMGTAGDQAFGGAIGSRFVRPRLRLLFFLEPPTIGPLAKRANFVDAQQLLNVPGTSEQLLAVWPTMGRQRVTVMFAATGTLAASIRVGIINNGLPDSTAPFMIEDTAATATIDGNTNAQASVRFIDRHSSFTAAYVTRTAGAGDCQVNIVAED